MRFGFGPRWAGNGRDVELTRDYETEPEQLKETAFRSENRAGMNLRFGLVILLTLGWCRTSFANQCTVFNGTFLQGTYDCVPYQLTPWTYFVNPGVPFSSGVAFTSAGDAYAAFVAAENFYLQGCQPVIGPLSDFTVLPPLLGNVPISEYATAPVTQACFGRPVTDDVGAVDRQRFATCPEGYQLGYFADGSGPTCYGAPRPTPRVVQLQGLVSIEPDHSLLATAVVIDSAGNPVPGAIVRLRVDAVANSGGHVHGDNSAPLRRGKLNGVGPEIVAPAPTAADGTFAFTFKAPLVSGTYTLTASCDNMECTQQGGKTVDVKIDGLIPLADTNFYDQVGSTPEHPNNHFLTPEAEHLAELLAYTWKTDPAKQGQDILLSYNDASLVWGGVLDITVDGKTSCRGIGTCNWQKPHAEHRRGTVMDVRANGQRGSLSPIDFLEFEDLVTFNGGTFLHEGEGTQNEHYHVRFLGRAE